MNRHNPKIIKFNFRDASRSSRGASQKEKMSMLTNRLLKKILSPLVICCILSSIHLTQAFAFEQQEEYFSSASRELTVKEVFEDLNLLESCATGECIRSEEALINITASPADALGWLAIYHIFQFIKFGGQCLETMDQAPCESMVTHLMTALFLAVLLG
jgi:hypothetical protein